MTMRHDVPFKTFIGGAVMPIGSGVQVTNVAGQAQVIAATAAGQMVGTLERAVTAIGDAVSVRMFDITRKVIASAAVAPGDLVGVGADGKFGAGAGFVALTTTAAADEELEIARVI